MPHITLSLNFLYFIIFVKHIPVCQYNIQYHYPQLSEFFEDWNIQNQSHQSMAKKKFYKNSNELWICK